VRALPFALLLAAGACGGRTLVSSTTPLPDASSSALTACSAEVTANCARFESCNANNFSSEYSNTAGCETRRNVSCLANLTAPGTAATPDEVAACATATATESCESLLNGDPLPAACVAPAGSRSIGSGCAFGGQCSTGFCEVALASACGTCHELLTAGTSCADLVSCGPGLSCFGGVCGVSAGSGAECGATQPCVVGLACVIPAGVETGTCQAEATALGAPCVRRNLADAGPGCDPTQGPSCRSDDDGVSACQAIATATAGEACNSVDFVSTDPTDIVCVDGSVCTLQSPGNAICVARAADGASCNSATGPFCMPLARCVGSVIDGGASGTCVPPGTAACP
jgi:hypothetical protein